MLTISVKTPQLWPSSCRLQAILISVHVAMGRPNIEFLICVYFLEEGQKSVHIY